MNKLISSLVACTALMAAQTAAAQHTTPYLDPAAPWTFTGTADVSKGLFLPGCAVTIVLSGPDNNGDGLSISHTDLSNVSATMTLSGGLCGAVTIDPIPAGKVKYTGTSSSGTLTFEDVYAHTITLGDCSGDLAGAWDQATGTLTIASGTMPPVNGGPPCTIDGEVQLTTPTAGSGTIVP